MFTLLAQYDRVLYLLLLVGLLLFARRAWLAWQDLQSATFRLEEEHARQRLQQSVLGMLLSAGLMLAVFFAVALGPFPATPSAAPNPTLQAADSVGDGAPTPQAKASPTPVLPAIEETESHCDPQQVFITYPAEGDTVSGKLDIRGTATGENFGFYKVEFAPVEQPLFLTIEVGRTPKVDDVLVADWDTGLLPPGEYWLQLVVVDNQGNPVPPCRVRFRIEPPPPGAGG